MTHVGSQKIFPVLLNKAVFFSITRGEKKYSSPIKEYSFPGVFRAPNRTRRKCRTSPLGLEGNLEASYSILLKLISPQEHFNFLYLG